MVRETRDDTHREGPALKNEPTAGVVLLYSDGPRCICAPFDGGPVRIGRDDPIGATLTDERLSRHHAEVSRRRGAFVVRDLGSRNGTYVDGRPLRGETTVAAGAIVRTGGTVASIFEDVSALADHPVEVRGGIVCGPSTARVLDAAASAREPLAIVGETGSGKELVARAFHRDQGPFVAVNCATIQETLAERVLFGAKRGAFSGATTDADGLVQAADGGVLFLDEVDELALSVQAKLLRVIETKEVTAIGATAPRRVSVRFCLAAQRDLRGAADAGTFRRDLLFRVRTHIAVPPLRERREDIPYLIARELGGRRRAAHPKLVEACLLRPWPGNVRELLAEVGLAAESATDGLVRVEHLREHAGIATRPNHAPALDRQRIVRALEDASGNISAAARALGLHRTQLKRAMQKHDL